MSPFKSGKQRRYLWAKKPEVAEKWAKKYGSKIKGSSNRKKKKHKRNIKGKNR